MKRLTLHCIALSLYRFIASIAQLCQSDWFRDTGHRSVKHNGQNTSQLGFATQGTDRSFDSVYQSTLQLGLVKQEPFSLV
jgi:hypothetical protein